MSLSARQTSAYFAAFFILGATIASLGPTLPYLAENTGAALASLGLLFTLRSGGYLLGSLLGGRLYDHLPGHRYLLRRTQSRHRSTSLVLPRHHRYHAADRPVRSHA